MNFSSTFRKIFGILLAVLMLISLCSCKKTAKYQIQSMKYISDGVTTATYSYTYTADNKPAIITASFEGAYSEDYIDVFGYDSNGDIISYSRKYDTSIEENYTAEKITDNKYIFNDSSGAEHLTIIFDETGFIVSSRYSIGYITEYAYTYDDYGKPLALKQLDITPSGSNRIMDFEIKFSNKNTCTMKPVGENSDTNVYYEATYNIIK